jgi:single-strand DNA-binding protein
VEGRLQTRSWEGQDGQKRKTTEVNATEIQFLEPRGQSQAPAESPVGAAVGSASSAGDDSARDVDPDDIPF